MARVFAAVAAAILLFAGAVWYSQASPSPPQGYSGLQFAAMTAADAARTPLLAQGAAILDVDPDSPAARAGILPGEVVAAIDGKAVRSARQAAETMSDYHVGRNAVLTLYDAADGEVKPHSVGIVLAALPDPKETKKYSVRPPRSLAKEVFALPPIIANATWARRLSHGAFLKPLELTGLGTRRCSALAPEKWRIAGYGPDGSLFHVMAPATFQHALLLTLPLTGHKPESAIRAMLEETFGSAVTLSAAVPQPFGFLRADWGNARGGAGFVVWRAQGERLQLWVVAVAAAESAWALPVTAAVAFSINCNPAVAPREKSLTITSVSAQCLGGKCQDSDLAAAYLKTLQLGYVHDPKGRNYLINPKRDLWANGAKGPGYYHQVNGENEKLEPGRTNDAIR
ncbi:MAG: PDZ domain-containing protein [Alphaproteobacteria bacterium]|nr:PDZ domain-containing protein [Alphaproteobacteria bacterium]